MFILEIYFLKLLLSVPLKYDIHQLWLFISILNFFPIYCVAIVVKTTMLMELNGIKIAATTGRKCPVTANESPTKL